MIRRYLRGLTLRLSSWIMFKGLVGRNVLWYRQTGSTRRLHAIGAITDYRISENNVHLKWESGDGQYKLVREFSALNLKKDDEGQWAFFTM